jgi:hypothetical protein
MMRELGHRQGPKIALEDRREMGVHWRHVMRLMRIRELAENDGDKAIVAKVDALLEREDKKFSAHKGGVPEGGTNPGEGGSK